LRLDCPTRWNSTYLMLKRALDAKDALVLFAIIDTSFEFSLLFEKYWGDYSTLLVISLIHDLESSSVSIGDAQSNVNAYLNFPLMARNSETPFDIIEYWKSQSVSFPVMSRIAKDVLAVPNTSVASESLFSMGGRVLTKYRSSLCTDLVEAFVTTQNWLFGYLKDEEVEDCFEVIKDVMPEDVDHDSLPRVAGCFWVWVAGLVVIVMTDYLMSMGLLMPLVPFGISIK
ncbi:putative AC9 transposase, partial [Bienertia sinuspersici]